MTQAALSGRDWLDRLPAELDGQRRVMTGLLEFSEATPPVRTLIVGCSLGRGAGDRLSDIDGAIGIDAAPGEGGAGLVRSVEEDLVAALPGMGTVVDVLRHRYGPADRYIRRIFAQFGDGPQADLTVMADDEIQRGISARPDWVFLYGAARPPDGGPEPGEAYAMSGEQVREQAFLGWVALIDLDKYLRRGSLWEAHFRLNDARDRIWALWAAATGALYPWHGLTQVLDHDPELLPPGISSTVAGLDAGELRRAARASAGILSDVSGAAARRFPADLPDAMAAYVTGVLDQPDR